MSPALTKGGAGRLLFSFGVLNNRFAAVIILPDWD
jgi:hypothetical protein